MSLLIKGGGISFFSPLSDSQLPEGCDWAYLPGGYPELHAKKLSANKAMRRCVKSFAAFGKVSVFIMQFMKGKWKAGERKSFDLLTPYIEVVSMGDGFTWDTENSEQDRETAQKAWEITHKKLNSGKYKMVVLDEINCVLHYNFLAKKDLIHALHNKPPDVHVVCTGRNAPRELIEIADLVTEMRCVKHPFKEQGIPAQKGIEF